MGDTTSIALPKRSADPLTAPAPSSRARFAICAGFSLLGAAALMYEVVWTRQLAAFSGSTGLSQTIILATYLGGFVVGSWILGRIADHLAHPLRAFAALALGFGCWGIFYPGLLSVLEWAHRQAVGELGLKGADLGLKLGLTTVILFPPSFLLGGTLPLLAQFLARHSDSVRAVSLLYGWGSVGAAAGAILAGFFLIPEVGLRTSTLFAGVISAAAAAIALLVAWHSECESDLEPGEAGWPGKGRWGLAEGGPPLTPRDRLVLFGVCASGLTGAVYWMSWQSYFSQVLGPSSHSSTLVQAAFITAVALGSLSATRWIARVPDLCLLFAGMELLSGVVVLVSLLGYERFPFWFWQVSTLLERTEEAYWLHLVGQYLFAFFILSTPAFFVGMALPVVTAQLALLGRPGAHLGLVYALNGLGMVAGVLGTGLLLLPWAGIQWAFQFGVFLNLATAAMVLFQPGVHPAPWQAKVERGPRRRIILGACASLALAAAILPRWDLRFLALGIYRQSDSAPSFAAYRTKLLEQRKAFSAEGGRVLVLESPEKSASLVWNGKPEASSGRDLATQILLGHLPMLFHHEPRDILVLGLSNGVTAGSILSHHPGAPVDCVEATPAMAAAARHFARWNRAAVDDPQLNLVLDDLRGFLRMAARRYDVIVSRPPRPWVAGAGDLYSADFYRDCLDHLREGGLMAQLVHTQDTSDDLVRVLVRTFLKSFPKTYAFNTGGPKSDFILLGSRRPIRADFDRMRQLLERPSVLEDLARIRIDRLCTVLVLQSHSPATLALFTGEGEANSDDVPHLEDRSMRTFFASQRSEALTRLDERRGPGERLLLREYLRQFPAAPGDFRALAEHLRGGPLENPALLFAALREYLERATGDMEAWGIFADELMRAGRPQAALSVLARAREECRGDPSAELKVLRREIEALRAVERDEVTVLSPGTAFQRSRECVERCIALDSRGHDLYYTELARLAVFQGDRAATDRWAAQALRYRRENPAKASPEVSEEELAFLKRWAAGAGS